MSATTEAPGAQAEQNGAGEQGQLDSQELVIEGDGQLSLSVGGKAPTVASVKLVGGKVDVEGEFKKGETVHLHVECQVSEIAFVDQKDAKTGTVIGCDRRHRLRITGVRRV